ncbi:MAG: TonB-dependent receptor plug domain-containing protein, partial [Weeksellaceae bacterium]|nr:TonB-dependent receptor plug domain-containing protein [Weeksellaceae bacterium]
MLKVFLSSVLLVLLAVLAQAQVVGVAEDEFGPVAGVEIHVNGAHLGYYSEADGSFTIDAGLGDTLLFVHPMTLAEKSILVSAHNLGVVRIEDAAVVLQEVVTMGYGIRESYDERNSSYAKIGGDRLRSTPTSSIDQALQGNVAGLQVGQSSGVPGARTPIFLRGITSISGVSDPLFVINGVPVLTGDNTSLANNANALSALDPNEIEDVTVLKDALATSLYGARGANGVVLITLKKGSRSRQDLSFSSELGFGSAAYNKMRPMNSEQFLHYTSHALFNTGQFSSLQDAIDFRSQSWDGVTDTDWTKLLERSTATTQRYNFAYSGGSDQITFSSNLSYLDQKGLYDNIYFRRLSFGLGSEWKANDRLSLTANISLSTTNQRNPLEGLAANNPI